MRLIFTILLIGLLKADAQMVINASSPYRPFVSANLLLDDYPNSEFAYSLRKLRTAYTGAAIRIRKDTTGQPEQDIFFVGNELDSAAIKSFLNARNGFVVTWYDQSGNGINATMSTQANQPRIANLGVIDRLEGFIAVRFDGSNDNLQNSTTGYGVNTVRHYAVSSRAASTSAQQVVYSTGTLSGTASGFGFHYTANTTSPASALFQQARNPAATSTGDYVNNLNELNMIYGITTSTSDSTYFNGADLKTSSHTRLPVNSNRALCIGARVDNTAGLFLNGFVVEIIMWTATNQPNKNAVETNVNSYYSIW